MPIQCQICNRIFENMISPTHLRTHGITGDQYKEKFDVKTLISSDLSQSLASKKTGSNNPMAGKTHTDEAKKLISEANIGKEPHNKGKNLVDEFGAERAAEISKAISDANTGNIAWNEGLTKETDKRVAKAAQSISDALTGITLDEKFGVERSIQIRKKRSDSRKKTNQKQKEN